MMVPKPGANFINHVSNGFVLTEHPLAELLFHKAENHGERACVSKKCSANLRNHGEICLCLRTFPAILSTQILLTGKQLYEIEILLRDAL